MYKKGDVFEIVEGCPVRDYVGTIGVFVDEVENGGGVVKGKVDLIARGPGVTVEDGKEWVFKRIWAHSLEKIGEVGIYVGQRVKICPDSIHYGVGDANPTNSGGVVQDYRAGREHQFVVLWDIGVENVYRVGDLIPEDGSANPKPKIIKNSSRKLIMDAVKLLNDCEEGATAKYCILYADKKAEINGNKACHAGLSYAEPGSVAVVSCIKQGIDEHPWFYKWLIDESPWAPAFIRRYKWSKENKVVVVRTDISSTFMCGALYATRIWEDHIQTDFMKTFRRKFPMGMLYPISCMVSTGGEWRFRYSDGGHFPFRHQPTKEVVKNFMAGVVKNISEDFRDAGKKGLVDGVFGDGASDPWVVKRFKEFEGVKFRSRWGDRVHFTKSRKVMTAFLASIQEEIMK